MKNDRKTVEKRWQTILQAVRESGEVRVEELTAQLGVSPMTVRRDLKALAARGLLEHQYGRAVSVEQAEKERRDAQSLRVYRDKIAAYAAGLVKDGSTVFINGSRTALGLLSYMESKKVTVYTNNGWAMDSTYPDGVSIRLIGGEIYDHIMVGDYVVQNLLNLWAETTFIGCAAVYEDGEFRYDIPTEIGINEIMISHTEGELYVLADHTKLTRRTDQSNVYGSCKYSRPVTLITDSLADPEIVSKLRVSGINVVLVPVG
ncbi:MAG: DeoR/GlpR transcriptional regulator [Lachnospiraceae bacterium]|nr:DeoR/GlpR transcriptional regulator [Lachnospiraceae bacterium]